MYLAALVLTALNDSALADEPVTTGDEPAVVDPVLAEPAIAEPVLIEPVLAEPVLAEPMLPADEPVLVIARPPPPLVDPFQVAMAHNAELAVPGMLILSATSGVIAVMSPSGLVGDLAGAGVPVFLTGAWLSVPIHGWTASKLARSLSMSGHWTSQSLGWCAIGAWMSPLMLLNPEFAAQFDSELTVPLAILGSSMVGWGLAEGQTLLNRRTFRRAGQPLSRPGWIRPEARVRQGSQPGLKMDYLGVRITL